MNKRLFIFILSSFIMSLSSIVAQEVSLSSQDMLRLHEFEGEQLVLNLGNNEYTSIIHSSDSDFSVVEYDEKMRVTKKIKWNYSTEPNGEASIQYSATYVYSEITDRLVSSELIYEKELKKVVTEYNDMELPIKVLEYTGEAYDTVSSEKTNEYDSEGRLSRQLSVVYKDDKKASTSYQYYYSDTSSKIDFDYYEDNKIKTSVRYQDDNTYTQKLYFYSKEDEGESVVETKYTNGSKKEEVFQVNGKVIRSKTYEN